MAVLDKDPTWMILTIPFKALLDVEQ
jgi:hypothetical protein